MPTAHGKLSIGFYVGLYLTHALSSSSPVHGQSEIMYKVCAPFTIGLLPVNTPLSVAEPVERS